MTSIIILSVIAVCLATLWVFLRFSRSQTSSTVFRFILVFTFCWTLSVLLTEVNISPEATLLWSRFSFFFPILILMTLHPFVYLFEGHAERKRSFNRLHYSMSAVLIAIGAFFAALSFTPAILLSVNNLHSSFGPWQVPYVMYSALSSVFISWLLYLGHRHAGGRVRTQYQLMLLGIGLSLLVAVITNLVLPALGLGEIRFLGPLGLVFFVSLTFYAIVTQNLFDIRLIIKRTVVYTGLLVAATVTYSMVILFFTGLFGGTGGSPFEPRTFITNLVATSLIAIGYDPLRRFLQERTDRFLYKKEYEEQVVMKELSKKLNDVVALDEALDIVMQTVAKTFHLRHAVTFVFQPGDHGVVAIKRIKQVGYGSTSQLFLNDQDFTISFFTDWNGVLIVEDFKRTLDEEKEKILQSNKKRSRTKVSSAFIRQHAVKQTVYKKLQALDAALAIPLLLNGQPIGLIFLSDRLSGDAFSAHDIALLETIGAQAISSIQKAKLYEGDQMKSEFVSIASHELLTPISAMEGYLSMILDENLGKVDKQAKEYLSKVYTSAKRLSLLVKDILSVSRIEAGRLKIEPQSLDIEKSITDTLDQLHFVAQEKKLTLAYLPGKEPLPPVWADPDRTTQVLVNLVSNAIKYTPSGSVTITACQALQPVPCVKVSVTDTGIGMTKQAQAHLFEKFYRVDSLETTGIVGTGLGLYITKSILERMGGQISVKSTQGVGTTFEFSLPLFKVESSKV